MPIIQGHSIEEQWDLSEQFAGVVETAIHNVVEAYISRTKTLTAAGEEPITMQAAWQQQVQGVFTPFLTTVYESGSLELAHSAMAVSTLPPGIGIPGVSDSYTANFISKLSNQMVGVGDDLWSNIQTELAAGVTAGESIPELADRVRSAGSMTTARATATARTTVVGASNAGSYAQASLIADDTMTKQWLATDDQRTRPDHFHADGQIVAMTGVFTVGGWSLAYPGDPTGPAGEVINCRCTLGYGFNGVPASVCACADDANSAQILMAAGFLPSVTTTETCVCPATASFTPPGHVSALTEVSPSSMQAIFKQFQGPQKISPAYGGAKIHKQLQEVKKTLGVGDEETDTLLNIIDAQYKLGGGKSGATFKQKYEEWLNSAAGKKTTANIPKFAPDVTASPVEIPTIPQPTAAVTSSPRGLEVIPQPKAVNLSSTGQKLGGTHGAQVLQDLNGDKWIFKPYSSGDKFIAKLDQATAKLQSRVGLAQPSVYDIEYGGQYGSIQSMHDAYEAFPGGKYDPTVLSPLDVLDLQKEQIVDWLISNNDAHTGNFLRLKSTGHLVGVDKGQAFKYLSKDTKLDWTKSIHTPLAPNKPTYQSLWKAFAEGKNVSLGDPGAGELSELLDRIQGIDDNEFKALFRPYAEAANAQGKLAYNDVEKFLTKIVARKNSIKKDFEDYYARAEKARADALGVTAPPVTPPVAPIVINEATTAVPDVIAEGLTPIQQTAVNTVIDKLPQSIKDSIASIMKSEIDKGTEFSQAVSNTIAELSDDDIEAYLKIKKQFEDASTKNIFKVLYDTSTTTAPDVASQTQHLYDLLDEVPKQDLEDLFDVFVKAGGLKIQPTADLSKIFQVVSKNASKVGEFPEFEALSDIDKLQLMVYQGDAFGEDTAKIAKLLESKLGGAEAPLVPSFDTSASLDNLLYTHTYTQINSAFNSLNVALKYNDDLTTALQVARNAITDGKVDISGYSDEQLLQMMKMFGDHNLLSTKYIDDALTKLPSEVGAPVVVPVTPPSIIINTATEALPTVIDPLDISHVSDATVQKLYKIYKGSKPVTPNWGGTAIYKNLQAIKATLADDPAFAGLNDGQLLKMLDKAFGGKGTGKSYFNEVSEWLKTPAGKKTSADLGLPTAPITSAPVVTPATAAATSTTSGTFDTKAAIDAIKAQSGNDDYSMKFVYNALHFDLQDHPYEDVIGPFRDHVLKTFNVDLSPYTDDEVAQIFYEVSKPLPVKSPQLERLVKKIQGGSTPAVVTPAAAAVGDLGDISKITANNKDFIFKKIKANSITLSSPPKNVYDAVQAIKLSPQGKDLNDLQILRILDEQSAAKFGVADSHLYEKKVVEWLKTKPGKDWAKGIRPVNPNAPLKIDLKEIPRNITEHDEPYSEISRNDAVTLQNTYEPWTPGEKASLRYYTGNNYTEMNNALRGSDYTTKSYVDHIRKSQAGMRPSTRPLMLYRGTGLDALPGVSKYAKLTDVQKFIGKTVQDKGFMSTSVGGKPAFGGRLLIEFEAPTGTPMAFVDHISKHPGENEMLLAAGTKYRVISAVENNGKIVIRVRIVR
jgi:hypothetical protein